MNENSRVMRVMEIKPSKNKISAQRSSIAEFRTDRIEKKESTALSMKMTLSIASALSIKKLVRFGWKLLTIVRTVMQAPTIVAEFGKM